MTEATCYCKGRALVYVRVGDEHFAVDGHWAEYLELRKERPPRVTLFSTLRELKRALLRDRGVLV